MIAANILGNIGFADQLRPESLPPGGLFAHMATLGCLDAPDMMPAGACCECVIFGGEHRFPAQVLSLR